MYNENKSYVYVLAKNGTPLMPTKRHRKVQIWLREGKAKVVRREPFTIKLLFDTKNEVPDVKLGVDTGSKKVGTAAVDSNGVVLYTSEVQTRCQEVTKKMTQRKGSRRLRRLRKCRYRKPRFLNRKNSKRKDRYSPTLISKKDTHTREIEFIRSILPIKQENIIIESTNFDTHKITNPNVYGWQYQRGPLYQYESIRQVVLDRDNYQCQKCKVRNTELHVHHIVPRSKSGNDSLENLITLCKNCHDSLHKGLWTLNLKGKRGSKTRSATQVNTICSMLRKEYPEAQETFGYITSINRRELGLPKAHWIDAAVIASKGKDLILPEFIFKKRTVSKGDYQQTKYWSKSKDGFNRKRITTGKIHGFRKFDKVEYLGKEYFIKGRRKNGNFVLMDIEGNTQKFKSKGGIDNPSYKSLKRLIARNVNLCIKEKAA